MTKKPFTVPHGGEVDDHAAVDVYDGRVDLSVEDGGALLTADQADQLADNLHAAAKYARKHPPAPRAPRADVGLGQGVTVDALLTRPSAMQARIADMMQETSVVEQLLRARGTDDDGQPVRYLTVTTMDPT